MFVSKSRPAFARIARAAAATNRVTLASRGFVSATNVVFEKLTISVPTMGDSITEVSKRYARHIFPFQKWKLCILLTHLLSIISNFIFEQGTIVEWLAQVGQKVEEDVSKHESRLKWKACWWYVGLRYSKFVSPSSFAHASSITYFRML